jgi:hypothetical protein
MEMDATFKSDTFIMKDLLLFWANLGVFGFKVSKKRATRKLFFGRDIKKHQVLC